MKLKKIIMDGKIEWTFLKNEIDADYPIIIDIQTFETKPTAHVLTMYGYRCKIVDNVIS